MNLNPTEKYDRTILNRAIVSFLKKKVAEFGLEGKITCVVTDNGSNMVNAINQWDGIERLPCAAHTLQLSINRAFQKTNIYIKRIKRLVHFFTSSPKQSERLDNAQKECQRHKNTSLQDISDNSSDDSDDDDGTNEQWLGATLPLSDNYDDRANGRRLKKWLLLPHEWNLLKQIVDLLEPFEDATTYFSGTSYATLSIIYPLIQVLKFKYAENDEVNDDDLELEQDAPNFQHEESDEESDLSDSDEEDNPELDTPEQSMTHHHQTRSKAAAASTIQPAQDILKIMKQTIYNSLFVYWNEPIMIGLLASLLDPRLKTLSNWDEETRNKAKTELMHQFKELIDLNLVQSSPSGSLSQQQHHSRLHSSIFGMQVTANPFSELESYLDPIRTPIADHSVNPFEWWAIRKTQFPNVAKLARKYLSIPGSSVPSERLFSDVSNQITAKCTRLDSKLAGKMMFLKRNSNAIHIF
ncbi:zinc finger BED domain-containing protein 1-like [Rhizophagus irregularis DAOM 181602=DAOM 197198]|nr:zinc finger BED domain-containing protein 1-like [Rhizophagus irregularis DAOM 181602=DAOM 197198]